MVIVAALLGNREGSSAAVLDAVATGDVRLAISDDQLSELVRVVGYQALEEDIRQPVRAFEIALDIGYMGFMYHPRRLDWPSLRDPKDGWIFDLAYTAGADFIVSWDHAVMDAAEALGFVALFPDSLVDLLHQPYETE